MTEGSQHSFTSSVLGMCWVWISTRGAQTSSSCGSHCTDSTTIFWPSSPTQHPGWQGKEGQASRTIGLEHGSQFSFSGWHVKNCNAFVHSVTQVWLLLLNSPQLTDVMISKSVVKLVSLHFGNIVDPRIQNMWYTVLKYFPFEGGRAWLGGISSLIPKHDYQLDRLFLPL